ncbi:SRPBCC family protein [Actomonas aquatica]|uniref:SRPBCC family protein n=1 Tax=Actomonas aquatica TaxID=2866162 RepID=A0ABZ1C787_9BACT|nr:SRPBCC family protein [Opitutus sp. WL0086]WRQ87454.1 SRPBCC family protein [Opitutus sp. WL0086]
MSNTMILLVIAVVLVVVFVVLVWRQPQWIRCTRSATVGGTPEQTFALINSLPEWQKWSPWEGLDPNMQRTFSGPPSGVGAVYAWNGNAKVGAGSMEVVESMPSERVKLELVFLKPFAATMMVTFELAATTGGTLVTWTSEGPNSTPGRIMGVFCNMDKMMGDSYEKGLAQLDAALRG